jgi:endonuclease/exonuclease/phosphatase family metal-dependent hydrolase
VRYDVAGVVSQLAATIVCLQEDWVPCGGQSLKRQDGVTQAADSLGAAVHRAPMCAQEAAQGSGRLCISVLTALPVTSQKVIALGRGPGDGIPRIAQVLTLRTHGGRLRLVNTHLTYSVLSPLQLWRLWRKLKPDQIPTVIAGDLNMPAFIARRYPGLTGLVSGPTFPAEQPVLQLDHVLVSRGIDAGPGAVLPHAGSDHRPIRAEFCLNGS